MYFIKIPRAVFSAYWMLPWKEVVHAAEAGADGIKIKGPAFTPWRERPLKPEIEEGHNRFHDVMARYDDDCAIWESERDHAYVREGDGHWTKGRTFLYQQNW